MAPTSGVWRREGEVWIVGLDGRTTTVRHSKGLQHLAYLLERPGQPVSSVDLVAAVEGHAAAPAQAVPDPMLSVGGLGDAGELLDAEARSQYRRRLEEARAELDEAERFHDPERAAQARVEIEFLARELSAAVGLGGRERRAASVTERARVNVTRSIKSAIDRIAAHDRELAEHLRVCVRTGASCVYEAPAAMRVTWTAQQPKRPAAARALRAAPEPPPRPAPPELIEREADLERIDAALTQAGGGRGGLLVLQGPGGIGKSSLVAVTASRAPEHGFTVASGRGGELERAFTFGVTRQLFDPLLAELPAHTRIGLERGAVRPAAAMLGYVDNDEAVAREPVGDTFPIMNGLYWLAARLSENGPLALIVDDAHNADDATLQWLTFMTARVSQQPILLVVASRDAHPKSPAPLRPLLHSPAAERLELAPLTQDGAEMLVRRTWPDAHPEFCAACHAATAGNPFYLHQLLASARAAGLTPDAAGARQLRDVTPEAVTRLVMSRLDGLPPEARTLAQACAVAEGADLALAAGIAQISDEAALEAVDALAAAGIVESEWPLRFTHPLLAAAVDKQTPLGTRTLLRERAAELLTERGAPASEVAAHLMHARPCGDAGRLRCLREAAREASNHAAPAAAAQLLQRALAEPPDPDEVPWILLELARAHRDAGDKATAVAELERALTLTADPLLHGRLALELSGHDDWDVTSRVALVDEALARVPGEERELRFSLEARAIELLNEAAAQSTSADARRVHDERLERVVQEAGGTTEGERQLLAIYAGHRAMRADITAAEARELACRALDDGTLMRRLADGEWSCDAAIEVLTMVDSFDLADRHARTAERRARALGAVGAAAAISLLRAIVAWHRGALLEAEALVNSVLAVCREVPDAYVRYVAQQVEACVAIELDDLAAAERASEAIAREGFAPMGAPHLRGRLHAARGQYDLAVPELLAAFELQRSAGRWRSVVMGSPRNDLAMALVAVGRRQDALALAYEEVQAARRFGAPSALGMAYRTLGHADGEGTIEHLREAAAVLDGSQASLVRAHVLVDLGAAERAEGDAVAARGMLREALDLCAHAGAKRLAQRARAELAAAGGRPAAPAPRAAELLSPGERRIVSLAAEGATQAEIAEAMFLSVAAASAQLSAALTKLDVQSLEDLEAALLRGD